MDAARDTISTSPPVEVSVVNATTPMPTMVSVPPLIAEPIVTDPPVEATVKVVRAVTLSKVRLGAPSISIAPLAALSVVA